MKRLMLYICLGFCMLSLAACNRSGPSVGIIGGADGPTSVFVTDGKHVYTNDGNDGNGAEDGLYGADRAPDEDTEEELSGAELLIYESFLNRDDVYGFLLSNYDNVLDADFGQVFYSGAGVGEIPSPELRAMFLDALGITEDEVFGDITYISTENADQVLRRVTGHKLSDLWRRERDLDLYAVQDADGYFIMAGDTNRITVRAVSGVRLPGNRIIINSEVPYESFSDDTEEPEVFAEFQTVLRETDDHHSPLVIVSNHITGGWMAEWAEWEDEEDTTRYVYAEAPPFAYASFVADPDQDFTLPCTLEKISETDNGIISGAEEWADAHWDEWLKDPDFAAAQDGIIPVLPDWDPNFYLSTQPFPDRDRYYVYNYDSSTGILRIWNIMTGEYEYIVDLSAYVSPDGWISPDNLTAQNLRWARIVNGILFVSHAHPTYAESSDGQNAYITAINLWDGSVIWRSDPLVSNAWNFDFLGVWDNGLLREGVIVCGYGFTDEEDSIYQISMTTGKILNKTPVATQPDAIVYADGSLYVHCYDRDYEFEIAYG